MTERGFQCWFCGEGISDLDREAIEITARNLWSNDPEDDPSQIFYLHPDCAAQRLQGANMKFCLDVFSDPN